MFKVTFAERCAWRAIYITRGDEKVVHIGIDPTFNDKARVFFGIGPYSFGFYLPQVSWSMAEKYKCLMPVYCTQQRLKHYIDGRY